MPVPVERGVIVVIEHDGRYLLLKRRAKHSIGKWECPAGKLEEGELPEHAAYRELDEEIGLRGCDMGAALTPIGTIYTPSISDPTYTGPFKMWNTQFYWTKVRRIGQIHIGEPDIHSEMGWASHEECLRAGTELTYMTRTALEFLEAYKTDLSN